MCACSSAGLLRGHRAYEVGGREAAAPRAALARRRPPQRFRTASGWTLPAAVITVVRRVPALETIDDRSARKSPHGRARAQDRRAQRMAAPEILREHFVRQRFGVVVLHADLFEDDLLFLDDVFFGKERTQHQVGEHVKGDGQVFVQHLGIEADHLFRGEGVEHPADRVHLPRNLLGGAPRGALEDHVLDEMRDAVQGRRLAARTGAHPDADGHRAHVRHVLGHQHQPVRQLMPQNCWRNLFHESILPQRCIAHAPPKHHALPAKGSAQRTP